AIPIRAGLTRRRAAGPCRPTNDQSKEERIMRTRTVVVLSMLLTMALLVPTSAWARRVTASGSLTVNLAPPGSITNQLVVTSVTLDQESATREEVEQTVTMPLPGSIYTVPYVVNKETTAAVS